ncbi:MAG: hypothetical protein AAGD05_11320 [Bacteroidota bacterium]
MKHKFLTLLLLICFCACDSSNSSSQDKQESEENKDPGASKQEMTTTGYLSQLDQQKLARAKGKTTQVIDLAALRQQIDQAKDRLHLFSFWNLHHTAAQDLNSNLMKVQRELGEERLKINYISLDAPSDQLALNHYLRTEGFTDDAYLLVDSLPYRWPSLIESSWNGDLPALLLVNESDGTFLFYQQKLSFEELLTICQSLVL